MLGLGSGDFLLFTTARVFGLRPYVQMAQARALARYLACYFVPGRADIICSQDKINEIRA